MRLVRLVSLVSFAVLAACGGGDNPTLTFDAAAPDGTPAPPDAGPPDACGLDYCAADNACVDFSQDEAYCGDCDTSCTGGTYCETGDCICPPAWVPANPIIGISQLVTDVPGLVIGFGVFSNDGTHALIGGIAATGTETGVEYMIDGENPGTPPFLGSGYNVMLQGQTPTADAAVYATSGTITFSEICAGGFAGVANNVTFSAVDSLTNPVIVPGGCTFDVASVTFAFGSDCP